VRRDTKLFPPWKPSPLTSSGKPALCLEERRAGSSGRRCHPPRAMLGGRLKERCFTSAALVLLVFPAWFAWLRLNLAAKRCQKTQAPKHLCWCSDAVNEAVVGFGPEVSTGQTSAGVWMRPSCLGESLYSWRRAGPCQTPSSTLPAGLRAESRAPTPLSTLPPRAGTGSRAEVPSPPRCFQSNADCCPVCLWGPAFCSSAFHNLSSPAQKRAVWEEAARQSSLWQCLLVGTQGPSSGAPSGVLCPVLGSPVQER